MCFLNGCKILPADSYNVAAIFLFQVALTQLWGMGLSRIAPSFGRLVGCVLILVSVFYTMYIGPEKEMNDVA